MVFSDLEDVGTKFSLLLNRLPGTLKFKTSCNDQNVVKLTDIISAIDWYGINLNSTFNNSFSMEMVAG